MRKLGLAVGFMLTAAFFIVTAQEKKPRSADEKKAIEEIRQLGGLCLDLAQNDSRLEVSYQITDGKITDNHLAPLKRLKEIAYLNLRGQNVTDDMLKHIAPLTSLSRLHLEKTKITDKGLPALKALANLEYLNLYGTEIGDQGLANLEGLKKLKKLYVWQTKVTDKGVEKLKKALPQVEIIEGFEAVPPPKGKEKAKDKTKEKAKAKAKAKAKEKKK